MDLNKQKRIFGYVFIILVILSMILMFAYLRKASQCDLNPFVYIAKKTYDQGMEISCSCRPLDPRYSLFYFDKDGVTIPEMNFKGPDIEGLNLGGG